MHFIHQMTSRESIMLKYYYCLRAFSQEYILLAAVLTV